MAEPVRARRLSDEEGRRLQQIVRRGKHGSIRVRRAMMIMASASGTPVPAIARLTAAEEDTVRDVIHAFNDKGLGGCSIFCVSGDRRSQCDGCCAGGKDTLSEHGRGRKGAGNRR
jgi:hypothetical protein